MLLLAPWQGRKLGAVVKDVLQFFMTTNRHALSDEKWALVRPFIPKHRGRHGGDERQFIDAVLWIASTGSPWRDLPEELGHWNRVYQRFAYWCSKGHFESIFQAVQQPDIEEIMVDSTSCKARQASSGAQKKRVLNRLAPLAAG